MYLQLRMNITGSKISPELQFGVISYEFASLPVMPVAYIKPKIYKQKHITDREASSISLKATVSLRFPGQISGWISPHLSPNR